MVRTMSAKLRRSFAQSAEIGSLAWLSPRRSQTVFVAASLLQSALLIGLIVAFAMLGPLQHSDIAALIGALAAMTSGYILYMVLANDTPTHASQRADAHAHETRYEIAKSDAEQLTLLKARVSHDLRTPLNAMIGFSEMMHREVLGPVGNEHYREYAAHIRNSAEHFRCATEKTLAVTELLASPPSRLRDEINLTDLLEDSLSTYRSTAVNFDPDWSLMIDTAVTVECNRMALQNALHHLWGAGGALATSMDTGATPNCEVHCRLNGAQFADLHFTIDTSDACRLAADSELAPGAELSLLLARLGVEAAGGTLTVECASQDRWQAVVSLPLAQ